LWLGRARTIATWRNSPHKVTPNLRPTDNQSKDGWGEIVGVRREDDANGKWNYEVVVRTNGKEWGFEVDPNGKFLKKHTEIKR